MTSIGESCKLLFYLFIYFLPFSFQDFLFFFSFAFLLVSSLHRQTCSYFSWSVNSASVKSNQTQEFNLNFSEHPPPPPFFCFCFVLCFVFFFREGGLGVALPVQGFPGVGLSCILLVKNRFGCFGCSTFSTATDLS